MRWAGVAVIAAVSALSGCAEDHTPATELVVVVDAEPGAFTVVDLTVIAPSSRFDATAPLGPGGYSLPLTLGVQHVQGPSTPVEIVAVGRSSAGDATVRAITGFVIGQSRVVRLYLAAVCTGVTCAARETCTAGACTPAEIAAETLPPWTGEIPGSDAGTKGRDDGGNRDGGGSDSGTRDASPADGGAPDAGPTCACRLDTDDCDPTARTCVRRGFMCSALAPCDTGYTCTAGSCECTDRARCGIRCVTSAECPATMECDTVDSVCRAERGCLWNAMCEATEVCVIADGDRQGDCSAPGGRATGSACTTSYDCVSGRCYTGVCVQSCLASRDCGSGTVCVGTPVGFACVAPGGTMCATPCTAAQACAQGGTCVQGCEENADCAAPAECSAPGLSVPISGVGLIAACTDVGTTTCGPQDFIGGRFGGSREGGCILPVRCFPDAPRCPAGYTCMNIGTVTLCGRAG